MKDMAARRVKYENQGNGKKQKHNIEKYGRETHEVQERRSQHDFPGLECKETKVRKRKQKHNKEE